MEDKIILENTNITLLQVNPEALGRFLLGATVSNNAMLYQQPADIVQTDIAPRKARMRTIPKAFKAIKDIDPSSAITQSYIRTLCKNGKIRTLPVGNRKLINLDELLEYVGMGA